MLSAHVSTSWALNGAGEGCVITAGQSPHFCCPFSCPFLIKENLKPLLACVLCPLSLPDAPSFPRSRQCSKVVPKLLGSPKGYLPGCGLTSPWACSTLRSLELCWWVVKSHP